MFPIEGLEYFLRVSVPISAQPIKGTSPETKISQAALAPVQASQALHVKSSRVDSGLLKWFGQLFTSKKVNAAFEQVPLIQEKAAQQKLIAERFSLSTPSTWTKFKDAIRLSFQALGKVFKSKSKWTKSQGTSPVLAKPHYNAAHEFIGKETITRKEGITDLISSKEAEKAYLTKNEPGNPRIDELSEEIKDIRYFAAGSTWATANRVRDEGSDFEKGKSFLSAQSTYIPAIVNNRTHQISFAENGRDPVLINRSGAISHLADGSTNLAKLVQSKASQETIQARREVLNDQMVQYLKGQISALAPQLCNADSIARRTNTLQITQVGLLNPKKAKTEKGVAVSEKNQMWDMAQIFSEFNGKQIVFSDEAEVTHPFLSGNKVIMPKSLLEGITEDQFNLLAAKPMQLSCTFINCSVQGLKKNVGDQAIVNLQGTNNLRENIALLKAAGEDVVQFEKDLEDIEDRLKHEESGYQIAEDILLLQQKMSGAIGVNCFSGKDRTSYLLTRMVYHYLSENQDAASKRKLASDLTSIEGLASDVIEQNTGHRFMKIEERRIMGINTPEDNYGLTGHFLRVAYAVNAFFAKS